MIDEIKKFREKYPVYADMDDMTLANSLAKRFSQYSDLPSKVKNESQAMTLLTKEDPEPKANYIKNFTAGVWNTIRNIGQVYPALEYGANIATSLYGVPAAGLAGLASLPFGLDTAEKVIKNVSKTLVYEPQTRAGTELQQAGEIPGLGKAASMAGKHFEKQGKPDLAATAESLIRAAPIIATISYGGIKAGVKPSTSKIKQQVSSSIIRGVEKGIKPKQTGKGTYSQLKGFGKKSVDAVTEVIRNKNYLELTDEFGRTVKGELPKNLKQFSQAIEQTKRSIFEEYNELTIKAGRSQARVNVQPIAGELRKIGKKKVVNDLHPTISKYVDDLAERLESRKFYTTEEAQDAIATLNNSLETFYRNPSYENANKAYIDSLVANNLRKSLDNVISKATGAEYQRLKNSYGSLKALEEDVTHAALRDAKKAPMSLIDFTDVFTGQMAVKGILSADPAFAGAAITGKSLAKLYKIWNDPNRIVRNMFIDAEKNMMRPTERHKVITPLKYIASQEMIAER